MPSNYGSLAQFEALAGGTVTLTGLTSINAGTVQLRKRRHRQHAERVQPGSCSTGGFTFSTLQQSNGGVVDEGSLRPWRSVSLNVAGAESLTLASITSFVGDNITVSGGATLSLPGLTGYSSNSGSMTTLEATGMGSILNLANLTSITVPSSYGSQVQFEALAGGTVTLTGLTSINTGTVLLESNGAGSTLNVSNLAGFTDNGGYIRSTLQAINSGTIVDAMQISLSGVNLTIAPTAQFPPIKLSVTSTARSP